MSGTIEWLAEIAHHRALHREAADAMEHPERLTPEARANLIRRLREASK